MADQQFSQEIAAYEAGQFIGYMDVDEVRPYISRQEASVRRNGSKRYVVFHSKEAATKARALCNSSTRAALSTTQREELYQGLRRPGHGQTPTDGPVTRVITVVRKYRAGVGFINWGETEKFARKRFNPDKIPAPAFPSELAYRAFRAEQAARAAQLQTARASA